MDDTERWLREREEEERVWKIAQRYINQTEERWAREDLTMNIVLAVFVVIFVGVLVWLFTCGSAHA